MPTTTAPETLLLAYVADQYRATYRDEHARIARAVALVEAGNVTLLPDGTATVRSQRGQATYTVNGSCQCFDQAAPDGRCKHAYAKTFARKVACLRRKARYAVYLDAVTGEQVHGIAWPALDGGSLWYAPDEDVYAERFRAVRLEELVLFGHLGA